MNINGHITRISMDASSYDEICTVCGATDGIGTLGGLAYPCPGQKESTMSDNQYDASVPGNPYPTEMAHKLAYETAYQGNSIRPRTKMERLNDAKRGLEAKLAEVNKAIELLEKHPDMKEVIEALERVGI